MLRPEATWAQVTFLVAVREFAPSVSPGLPPWREGPAHIPVASEAGVVTDEPWRSRVIAAGARAMLYDERQSLAVTPPVELAAMTRSAGQRVTLTADYIEFLPTGVIPGAGPGGILVVQAELRGSDTAPLPVRWLAATIKDLARPPAGRPAGVAPFAALWGLSVYPDTEIMVAVNLAWRASTARALRPDSQQEPAWDALLGWAWGLARGTVPSPGMLRTTTAPATPGRIVRLPNRIAVVDRSGVAIVSTTGSDADVNIGRTLSEFPCVFQSIYTDVFLLGYLELLVTEEVGARLDELSDPARQPREFHAIELRMRKLHSRIWRTRITGWPWVNDMLSAFQEENGLTTLIAQLNDNVRDYGDQIERNYQHGLNLIILLLSMLGFLGVIAGIFAGVAAFMSVFGTGHWGAVVGIIATTAGVLALAAAAALLLRNSAWRELGQYLRR